MIDSGRLTFRISLPDPEDPEPGCSVKEDLTGVTLIESFWIHIYIQTHGIKCCNDNTNMKRTEGTN